MILEGQLLRNYNELYELILYCYKNFFILEEYKKLQENKNDLYINSSYISNHFILLAQKELALTLWKIYCDKNPNSNTVPKFRNAINKLLRECGCTDKQIEKENRNSNFENILNEMRQKFLAHTDMKRTDNKIAISGLKRLLDVVCIEFNKVCDIIDDEKIHNISKGVIDREKVQCYFGLYALYNSKKKSF